MADIENQEALTRIFGGWPSFHDAEVLSLVLDRHGFEDRPGPTLEAKVHVFQMTREVDERGYFRLRNHGKPVSVENRWENRHSSRYSLLTRHRKT